MSEKNLLETEYQKLIEEINGLAEELKDLGERRAEWAEGDEQHWDELDAAYRSAIQRKADEDDRRQAEQVEETLEEIQRPQRRVKQRRQVRTRQERRTDRPRHFGTLKAFRGEHAADDAYDCGLWLKAYMFGDEEARDILKLRQPEWRVQLEGTTTAGGFTVPDPLSATIIQVIEDVSVMMKMCRVWPMSSDTLAIPRLTAGQTVYVPGEGNAITASDTTWAQVSLTAAKRAVLTLISNELIADSIINFADIVAERAAYEIAYDMDNVMINGDNGGNEGGVIGILAAIEDVAANAFCKKIATYNTWAETTLADLNATKGKLPNKYYQGATPKWLMRRDFHGTAVETLLYAAGGNIPGTITAGVQPQLFGYPVYFSDLMPAEANDAAVALFGNWDVCSALGMRNEARIATSDQYSFNTDATAVRVTARWDAEFFDLGNTSVSGGIVGLYMAAS